MSNSTSFESLITRLTDALEANTAALNKVIGGKGGDAGESSSKDEGRSGGRARRSRGQEDDSKGGGSRITLDDVKAKANKFLDVSDDSEYDARVEAVFDPIFKKAKVSQLADLPEDFYSDVLDAIEKYDSKGGNRRRSV